jgi:hypothetical protein
MQARKLITLSTVAVLLGGTNLAIGQPTSESGISAQESSALGESSVRGYKKMPGPRMRAEAKAREAARLRAHKRLSIAPGAPPVPEAYARATARELEAGLSVHERTRLMREIPRLSSIGTEARINAIVPPSVRMAAAPLPPEIQRRWPQFRRDRAVVYRDQVVIVNPATSRIVALAATGS